MMRCKVGDLCIVIKTHPNFSDALGREVVIIGPARRCDADWRIEFRHVPPSMRMATSFVISDAYLLPIRPGRESSDLKEADLRAPSQVFHKAEAGRP